MNVAVKPVDVGVRLVATSAVGDVLVAEDDAADGLAGGDVDELGLIVRRGREAEVIDDAAAEGDLSRSVSRS